jgi:ribosomal protein RSM22 (predicted rRNA methylase)
MSTLTHKLPHTFEPWLARLLSERSPSVHAIAKQVKQLSDFYLEHPGTSTPWNEPFTANAYLAYFLPLNTTRLAAVWREVERFLPVENWDEIWDIGAGLSTTHWVLEGRSELKPKPFFAVEISSHAERLHQECVTAAGNCRWDAQYRKVIDPGPKALGVFSYSFLEMQKHLPDLSAFDHLLIVEPSTRDCGRALMKWRAKLLANGFHALAPCLHQEGCPLLLESERDWCHTRIHFEAPDWWREIESELPMQNRTLTYSYLLMSRTVERSGQSFQARVIGDTLFERGKSKQLICRGPKREFMSWLHREGEVPHIPFGALIDSGLEQAQVKSNELRLPVSAIKWTE